MYLVYSICLDCIEITHDLIVAVISILLLLILSYIFLYIIKARSMLSSWMKQFESSSLNLSIRVLAKSKSKEDIINAIAESVHEVSAYLYKYIENNDNDISRFIDVKIDNEQFDILIDRDNVEEKRFKDVLKEYGSIIVRVVVGVADRGKIDEFYNRLVAYNRITGNRIVLALLVAERVEAEAKVSVRHKAIGSLLLIEQSTE